ncbi:MAG: hypothetical protein B6244_02885 [Candidatus Cloacimonetes bacterium 4572_55]|nr:MAG: hypothetical protein B6244_02885 [Candidatus Cloacimonetes bacterium 4572_55]
MSGDGTTKESLDSLLIPVTSSVDPEVTELPVIPDSTPTPDFPESSHREKGEGIRGLTRLRFIILIFSLLLAIFAGFERWLHTTPLFSLKSISISGARYLLEDDLLKIIDIPYETNIFGVSLESLQKKLVAHPRIKSATAIRGLPDKLSIHVEEFIPVLLIPVENKLYEVGKEGLIMPHIAPGLLVDLPIVTGLHISQTTSGQYIVKETKLFAAALHVMDKVESIEEGWSHEISEIHFEPTSENYEIAIYTMTPGQTIKLDLPIADRQLERFRVVYDQIGRSKDQIKSFDLRFKNQVVIVN